MLHHFAPVSLPDTLFDATTWLISRLCQAATEMRINMPACALVNWRDMIPKPWNTQNYYVFVHEWIVNKVNRTSLKVKALKICCHERKAIQSNQVRHPWIQITGKKTTSTINYRCTICCNILNTPWSSSSLYIWNLWNLPVANKSGNYTRSLVPNI